MLGAMRATLSISAVVVLLIAGSAGYQLHHYATAWDAVEQAASHLDSSIQYEPVITMQAKMADLDVALKNYKASNPPKLVSKWVQHGKTVEQYEAVLSDLAHGLAWSAPEFNIYQAQWDDYGVRRFSVEEIEPACDRNKLVMHSSSLGRAYKLRGIRNLAALTGRTTFTHTPLDESAGMSRCTAEEQARIVLVKQGEDRVVQLKAQAERDAQVSEKEAKRTRSLAMCNHFKQSVKNGGATLTKEEIEKFLAKCEEVKSGARNDLW
jgi:hypothetical protein